MFWALFFEIFGTWRTKNRSFCINLELWPRKRRRGEKLLMQDWRVASGDLKTSLKSCWTAMSGGARAEFEITSLQLHFFLTLKWSGRFFGNSLYFTSLWKFEKKFHFTSLRFLKKWFFFTSLYFTSNFVSSEVTSLHFNFQKSEFFSLYLTSLRIFDGEKLLHFTLKWCFQVYFSSLFSTSKSLELEKYIFFFKNL